jgi:hypothetical protein
VGVTFSAWEWHTALSTDQSPPAVDLSYHRSLLAFIASPICWAWFVPLWGAPWLVWVEFFKGVMHHFVEGVWLVLMVPWVGE